MRAPLLAAAPGLVLAVLSALGLPPAARDLPTYFVPLRERTAAVLRGERSALWNPDVGCGEPFLANPQSAVLYPPAWLALVAPPERAVGIEAGMHLALLGAGAALLAGALGATGGARLAAGLGAVLAGPVAGAAGVLNNLTTLTWLPWLLLAAVRGRPSRIALAAAVSILAGEPQLALIGAVLALVLAPRAATLAGLALGGGLAAAQALPFLAWVGGGDRGPGLDLEYLTRGALGARDLLGVGMPGLIGDGAFLAKPTLPLWALALALPALGRPRRELRRLAAAGWLLVLVAAVAATAWGGVAWAALTAGLVRFPARVLLPAAIALVVAAAAMLGARRLPAPVALPACAAFAALGLLLGARPLETLAGAAAAALALAGIRPVAAALAGSLVLVPLAVQALAPARPVTAPAACLEMQRGGRVFAVAPSRDQARWVAQAPLERARSLGWGYTPLADGRRTARTFAPLQSARLAAHLGGADVGPAGRWWLDSLAAPVVIGQHPIGGMRTECVERGLVAARNESAWPEAMIVRGMPAPGEAPEPHGELRARAATGSARAWQVSVGAGGGLLLLSSTPDPGWRFSAGGGDLPIEDGPGILHGVRLPAGTHRVEARYRPPGLVAGGVISLTALVLLGVAWRRW